MAGILEHEWGPGSLAFWAYTVGAFALSILFTWVFNNTARSILVAILPHFMYSFTVNALSPMSDRAHILVMALLLRAARQTCWGGSLAVSPWNPPMRAGRHDAVADTRSRGGRPDRTVPPLVFPIVFPNPGSAGRHSLALAAIRYSPAGRVRLPVLRLVGR